MPQHPHTCARCGQPVDTRADCFEIAHGGHLHHAVCPTSPALAHLPPADPATARAAVAARSATPGDAPPPDAPAFLTMKQAGRILHVSDQTIRRYIRAGRLPARRIPGTLVVLLTLDDLLNMFVDAQHP